MKDLVGDHAAFTQSAYALQLLREWDLHIGRFWQICPKEMVARLAEPLGGDAAEEIA